jgi:prepilin-type processing-associated H-X9-DG protein
MLALHLLRRAPAAARYAMSCAALASMVLASCGTFALLAEGESPPPAVSIRPSAARGAPSVTVAMEPLRMAPAPANGIAAAAADPMRYIVLAWGAGVLVLSVYLLAGWLALQSLRRRAPRLHALDRAVARIAGMLDLRRAVTLIETRTFDVPAVLGVFHPVILMPVCILSELSAQQVEALIAHELAHVRRHDYLVNLLQAAVETVMFYHPAAWWISSRIREERENCCDDLAADICGDKCVYASALTALEHRRPPRGLCPAATSGEPLRRIRRVLKLPPPKRQLRVRSIIVTALVLVLVAVPLTLWAQNKSGPDARSASSTTQSSSAARTPINLPDSRAGMEDFKFVPRVSGVDLQSPGQIVKWFRSATTAPSITAAPDGSIFPIEPADLVPEAPSDPQKLGQFIVIDRFGRPGYESVSSVQTYGLPKLDFRLRDALNLADSEVDRMDLLYVLRGASSGMHAINVPVAKLIRSDPSVNIAIRHGDMIICVDAGHAPATTAPSTAVDLSYFDVAIAQDHFLHDGKRIDLAAIDKLLEAIPQDRRRRMVLQVSAATPDVTVERFFNAVAELDRIVKDLGLSYLSETGVQPSTEPATRIPQRGDEVGNTDRLLDQAPAVAPHPRDSVDPTKGLTIYEIAAVDATMRTYLVKKGDMELYIAQVERKFGRNSSILKNAQADLELWNQRIELYAKNFRAQFLGGNMHPNATTTAQATRPAEEIRKALSDCMSNLRRVHGAILLYSERHQSNLPPDLGATLTNFPSRKMWEPGQKKDWTDAEKALSYVCPDQANGLQVPQKPTPQWINQNTSYIYLGGANVKLDGIKMDASKVALAYEKRAEGHGGLVPVLFLDGHVEAVNKDQVKAIVAASTKAIDAAKAQ